MSGIVFQVDTNRVLQILSREIYDSPLALLRENVQNAYDAVRMRFVDSGVLRQGGRIDITMTDTDVAIADNGVGMTADVLRNNFWKPGSSGKHSPSARKAGVVGTFGIGAMANFGVCRTLVVTTRAQGEPMALRSVADRDTLKIAEDCITLEEVPGGDEPGTTVTATWDNEHRVSVEDARRYLDQYVAFLPVPVYLNGILLSQATLESRLPLANRVLTDIGSVPLEDGLCGAHFSVRVDSNGQLQVSAYDIQFAGHPVEGRICLLQASGQLMGLRWLFGLAPLPVSGQYQFGGLADLSFLQPTAGREAVSRDSIEQASRLVALAERAGSESLAATPLADKNLAFQQWVVTHGRWDLTPHVTVRVLPEDTEVPLGRLPEHIGKRRAHYYTGTDQQLLKTFANEDSCLLHVAQSNPRRAVQLNRIQTLRVPQVPDSAQITRLYAPSELSPGEGSVVLRVAATLRDDYLIPDADVRLADITHGVTVLSERTNGTLRLSIAKSSSALPPLMECYNRAYDLYAQVVKDFVRVHIYPRIQQFVPSSTRDGVDALRKLLERNRDLYRYEDAERGDLEGILGGFLSGSTTLAQALTTARSAVHAHSQRVSSEQVGAVEAIVPEVVASPVTPEQQPNREFVASPPILRDDVTSEMKILTTADKHPQLNSFVMFLGLSDRLMRTEGEFFRTPHTTRVLWGGHRVIYIFTDPTGRLNLYYDIELRASGDTTVAGGGMFPTTTLITKSRIFIPVPDPITELFDASTGPKEFFVRFDVLASGID